MNPRALSSLLVIAVSVCVCARQKEKKDGKVGVRQNMSKWKEEANIHSSFTFGLLVSFPLTLYIFKLKQIRT